MERSEDLRFAIEDARIYQSALIDLIYHHETKALGLLAICVPLGTATASGSAAGFFGGASWIGTALSYGLLASTVFLGITCYFCFKAMSYGRIHLPGRQSEFWLVAINAQNFTFEEAAKQGLEKIKAERIWNNEINKNASLALRRARATIMTVPFILLITAMIAAQMANS